MTLKRYLDDKPLYYDKIDYSRMPRAYESVKSHINLPKIVQIVGTNGKGSTGRFTAQMLLQKGLHVGHYTSPHLFKFNERIWIDGEDVSDETLELAHEKLQAILNDEFKKSLSYFEYTTLLAMVIFSKNFDYVILEAGLGGEYDATTVFPKILSVLTPVGYDHESFLGESIEEIATTKINSIQKRLLVSKQYEKSVYEIAKKICDEKKAELFFVEDVLSVEKKREIENFILKNSMPHFQESNLKTALCVLEILGFDVDLGSMRLSPIYGRAQKISKNITIDVGHNPMAAKALREHFKGKKVTLVYNSFKDKEYAKILDILYPIISKVEIIKLENARGMASEEILDICKQKGLECTLFEKLEDSKEYLVFGSFLVVEKFLKDYFEK